MDKIIIIDFGSQYTQLIARKVRACQTYCEIIPYHASVDTSDKNIKGIILSGSPFYVAQKDAPQINVALLQTHFPILAICYGAQYIAALYGGKLMSSHREFGKASLQKRPDVECAIMKDVKDNSTVWMSHGDSIDMLPPSFEIVASSNSIPVAAFQYVPESGFPLFGLQFHPEVYHSEEGEKIISNFLLRVCGCRQDWTAASFIKTIVEEIKAEIGDKHALMALSGGVDSTVAAVILQRAIGDRLHAVFVNNGLLRKNEYEAVLESYKLMNLNVRGVNEADTFYNKLSGVVDPERKRKIIGYLFVEIFEKYARALPQVNYLGQGTTYPDVIESIAVHGPSVTIKSHHNVGGLPEKMNLKIIEPIRYLFKDEVRSIGRELGIPQEIIDRHPFPGPGLGIRIIGDVTKEKVRLLQEADHIFCSALKKEGLYDKVWQAGAILLPIQSVGVMGDERTYENVVALRAVTSIDGMTADWARLPYDFLANVCSQIINQTRGINRVVYDISSKPPSTIEWE